MDPNDPGQAPDAPPPYGTPPASPYGAPPDSPYGAPPPPAYGAPPTSPYGAPPDSPYGAPPPPQYGAPPSAWGVPAPATPARKGPPRRLITALTAIILVVVIGAGVLVVLGGGSGKVLFSRSTYNDGTKTCRFDNAITTASTSDSVYMIADLKDTLKASDRYTLTVVMDGQTILTNTLAASKEFNCYVEQGGLGKLPAGVYKFTFTKDGKTEAEGTLTVK